jgi:hypothetical protein
MCQQLMKVHHRWFELRLAVALAEQTDGESSDDDGSEWRTVVGRARPRIVTSANGWRASFGASSFAQPSLCHPRRERVSPIVLVAGSTTLRIVARDPRAKLLRSPRWVPLARRDDELLELIEPSWDCSAADTTASRPRLPGHKRHCQGGYPVCTPRKVRRGPCGACGEYYYRSNSRCRLVQCSWK